MAKKNLSSVRVIAIGLLVAAVLFLLYLIILGRPSVISDCKDQECVRTFAVAENFNPTDCAKAPENFSNGCYYAYEIENLKSKKVRLGRYCNSIKDEEMRAGCFYETLGQMVMTANVRENLPAAIASLDASNCDKLNRTEWKEICISDMGAVKNAVDKKDISLCFTSTDISGHNRQTCAKAVQDKIIQDLLTKTK